MFGKAKVDGSRTGGRSRPCTTGWQAPWELITPMTRARVAVISLNKAGHARDHGRDGHCIHFSSSSRPWWAMYECVFQFPWIITPVMAPSSCSSPITPVIHMEEDEEHSITPVTMRKLGTAAITGLLTPVTISGMMNSTSSRPWQCSWTSFRPVMISLTAPILFFFL